RVIFFGAGMRNDRFTKYNVYFLTWGGAATAPIPVKDGRVTSGEAVTPIAFRAPIYQERDVTHDALQNVEDDRVDHYFWRPFVKSLGGTNEQWFHSITLPTQADDILQPAELKIALQGARIERIEHAMRVQIGSWRGETRWIGQNPHLWISEIDQNLIGGVTDFFLTVLDNSENLPRPNDPDVYLDWLELNYWRTFAYQSDGVLVSEEIYPTLRTGLRRYDLPNFPTNDVRVYELNDDGIIARFENVAAVRNDATFTLRFEDRISVPTEYFALTMADIRRPDFTTPYVAEQLSNPSTRANYLIITHPLFVEAAQELANYRESQGFETKVVNIEAIYNEFSHGVFSPSAIQSFLRFALQLWEVPPEYVLLIGDAHYNYKGAELTFYAGEGTAEQYYQNFVPTIHGSSESFGETAMDVRFINLIGNDALPDIAIGRLPVQRASELRQIIEKIIAYETTKDGGEWRAKMVMVADDDTTNVGDDIFRQTRENLIERTIPPAYDTPRVYLKDLGSQGVARNLIRSHFTQGALTIGYAGHGGRGNWADEGMFFLADIPNLFNDNRQPLVIATTCELAFFDIPERFGERAMGESLLLGRNRGAIATIGASRLTYASCNGIFDPFLYREIVISPMPEVGPVLLNAKIRNLIERPSPLCNPGLEQYMLFGDPALRLARPSLSVDVQLTAQSINPRQTFSVKAASVYDPFRTPPVKQTTFNGSLNVAVEYPNNRDADQSNDLPPDRRNGQVLGGEFGDVSFTMPDTVVTGEGFARVFAVSNDRTRIAIGGARFSARKSRILNIAHEQRPTELVVTVELANPRGADGVRTVEIEWFNSEDFRTKLFPMTRVGNTLTYRNAQTIPLPGLGERIEYSIIVSDVSGTVVKMTGQTFRMPLGPDLAIATVGTSRLPQLSYQLDRERNRRTFHVVVNNIGDQRPSIPVEVIAFLREPDSDANGIVDPTAEIIARGVIAVNDWFTVDPSSGAFERVTAVLLLDAPLTSGSHDVFLWVDPHYSTDPTNRGYFGKVQEALDTNNRSRRTLEITDFVVGNEEVTAFNLDHSFSITVPSNAVAPTTLSITSVTPPGEATREGDNPVYGTIPLLRLVNQDQSAFLMELASGDTTFRRQAEAELAFDLKSLRENVAVSLRFSARPEDRTSAQNEIIDLELIKWLDQIGAYRWREDLSAWQRAPSSLRRNENGTLTETTVITPVFPNTAASDGLRISAVEPDTTTAQTGDWAIIFFREFEYHVFFKPDGSLTYQRLQNFGRIGSDFSDLSVGLRRLLVNSNDPFNPAFPHRPASFGASLHFRTELSESGTTITARGHRYLNAGDGSAEVNLAQFGSFEMEPLGDWIIFLLDANRYEVRNGNNEVVLNAQGRPYLGFVDGAVLALTRHALGVQVFSGSKPFEFGDTLRVKVGSVVTMEADVTETGIYTLLRDIDATEPTVQLWVNETNPLKGSVIPPRPTITLLFSDRNGIDTASFRYEVRNLNDADFEPFDPQTYEVRAQPIDQVSVRHRPIFFIGTYVLRVHVNDLAGTAATSEAGDFEEYLFIVEEQPDLESPSFTLSTEFGALTDGQTMIDT
ncbi:MAG: C25 family cysteine peptidase, partial [Candidatus Poribacteria bacterium]|nr:C25 family cysteine peptidase [Candidatus Poribacteria bacterium]